ncbi:MAG: hypothetical protein K6G56_00085 [Clostridiales bacterium]|nr:hypothetical protein [Clostridiales bacterium]
MMIRRKKRKKTRSRISPGILAVISGLVLVIGVLLFVLLYNGKEEITERGTMMFNCSGRSAVIIRDEAVYLSSEYARIDFLQPEGASVFPGDALATVYKLGYSDELMQALLNTREEVYRAQIDRLGSTRDQRLEEMNEQISSLKGRIESCVMRGSGEDLLQLYRDLDAALKERMDYLKTKVQETETLRTLYASVEAKEELISAWIEGTVSEDTGVVSYYFDGYEQAINKEKLNMLSPDLVKRALKDSGSATWTTDDKTRVCRIVDPSRWYVAFLTESEELTRLAAGVEYFVEIEGYGTFKGVALEPVISDKKVVNVIEFEHDLGELINVRTAKINVSAAMNGIKVKGSAIRFVDGASYLELLLSDSHYTVRVDVLAVEGDFVIVRPHESGDILNEGVRYWNKKR